MTFVYVIPKNSAMIKAAAPMIGGISCPFTPAATSIAPAFVRERPAFFISGMVNVPTVTTFAVELPETMPVRPLAMTEALAGPPLYLPRSEKAKFMKYCPAPARSNNEPKRTKR